MTDYEFRMFIENLQSNVTFLQDAAEDLYDDLDELDIENKNEIDILKILLQFVRIGQLTAAMLRTVSDGEWGVQLWSKHKEDFKPPKESEANARLIAAVPELLEVLKKVKGEYLEEVPEFVEEAIKKVRGIRGVV